LKHTCPDCERVFVIPLADVSWLAEALRRNPVLKIICAACGRLELKRLKGLGRA
jgi:RNase P subunit RPR2